MRKTKKDKVLRLAALRLARGNAEVAAARLRLQAKNPPLGADFWYALRRWRVADTLDPTTF